MCVHRDELDGLQMLRQEVLKEVAELEHLLALRMRGIIAGVEQSSTGLTQRNDLAGLNVVHLVSCIHISQCVFD